MTETDAQASRQSPLVGVLVKALVEQCEVDRHGEHGFFRGMEEARL